MAMRDALGRGRTPVRRRFVGSTFITTPGTFNIPVPAGVDCCDRIIVGAGGSAPGSTSWGSGGGMAIQFNRPVYPGQVLTGTIGAPASPVSGATTAFGMTANGGKTGSSGTVTGGTATGGDVNLTGGSGTGAYTPGGCPSPAWNQDPANMVFMDSGGPYLHPSYTGRGNANSTGLTPGGGAGDAMGSYPAGGNGGVFIYWYVTE